jgi:hypothetical protein
MKKKLVGLLELETAVLECFLEKTPLNPLGVKLVGNMSLNQCPMGLPLSKFSTRRWNLSFWGDQITMETNNGNSLFVA